MEKQRFVFHDETGRELAPWELRAGMVITQTDYTHGGRQVSCVVSPPALENVLGVADEWREAVRARTAERLK